MKSTILRSVLIALLMLLPALAIAESWHATPFLLKGGSEVIDTFAFDAGGHAAPFFADLDRDSKRDLVIGSISGSFRFFKNIGTDSTPLFEAKSSWLMAGLDGEQRAQIPNFCCVAAGPQLIDIDNDGMVDLSAGSYFPGTMYWFKGLGGTKFATRQVLTDTQQMPLRPHMEEGYPGQGSFANYMANIAWVDWNHDGFKDLVIGNLLGELLVWRNASNMAGLTAGPLMGQPVFARYGKEFPEGFAITINGENASPESHCAPCVADWDGDGLWDLLFGSDTGEVFWLRNSGVPGKPRFESRERLLGVGVANQFLSPREAPKRGVRSQIHATDFNLDGKMDLLVGDWSVIEEIRTGLTPGELVELQAVRSQLLTLDKDMEFSKPALSYRQAAYVASKGEEGRKVYTEKAAVLERRLQGLLRLYASDESVSSVRYSGHVWVYLRKAN